jgi:hypothetical protein
MGAFQGPLLYCSKMLCNSKIYTVYSRRTDGTDGALKQLETDSLKKALHVYNLINGLSGLVAWIDVTLVCVDIGALEREFQKGSSE